MKLWRGSTKHTTDDLAASRHPFETYLLALAFVSGLPLIFGQRNSGSIEATLPPLLVDAWGAMLVLGSALALLGLYWRGHEFTALVLERSGLVGVGGAAAVYATSVVLGVGLDGLFSACIIGAFAGACFAQARRISRRIMLLFSPPPLYGRRHDD